MTGLLFLGTISVSSGPSQLGTSGGQNLQVLVDRLSWESVEGSCNYVWTVFPTGREAKQLIKVGKSATDHLLSVLLDPDKAVAAHLILCGIWKPPHMCGVTTEYPPIADGLCKKGEELDIDRIREFTSDEIIMKHHAGVLHWALSGQNVSTVEPKTLKPNKEQWCKYLASRQFRLTNACT
jgi:hypothetical protein